MANINLTTVLLRAEGLDGQQARYGWSTALPQAAVLVLIAVASALMAITDPVVFFDILVRI